MRWPWPPAARKFSVRLVVRRAEGLPQAPDADARLAVEVKWKGPKARWKGIRVCRNRTRLEAAAASVEWDEEFQDVVTLAAASHRRKEASAAVAFQPWDFCFSVLNDSNKGPKSESILGTASLNLGDYTTAAEEEFEIILPLSVHNATTESSPSLHLTLSLVEVRLPHPSPDASQRSVATAPLSPSSGDSVPSGKDELSVIRAGLRKVKHITDLVSIRRSKKSNREDDNSDKYVHSDGAEYPCAIDSEDDLDDRQKDEDLGCSTVRKSFSYGSLQSVNYAGGLFYAHARIDGEQEDWIYYSHRKSDAGYHAEKESSSTAEERTSVVIRRKRSILPWRKVKVPKKGEPLLKNKDGEEGGDDIDYDRRILTSSDGSVSEGCSANSMESVFGDDNFVVGNWESKEVLSRDGHLKLCTHVFFASIDQRSERAAGESACTALVAVIADWFQANQELMPNRSQFDSLIREGSLEWRKLCENETYRERFPDKHFDLETVLHAKIRPLTVAPNKSFVGFFQPESVEEASGFDFLDGAMSFDNIWEEISRAAEHSTKKPTLYVVSWNDHFFVLKVEADAYYIIDTLGERLYEGCDQAYILKFDDSSTIHKVPAEKKEANSDSSTHQKDSSESSSTEQDSGSDTDESELLVLKGKDACKEYIKSFLAAIPIRELQADIKKGILSASTTMHHRLQIEFHYTEPCPGEVALPPPSFPAIEEAPFEFSWPDPPPPMEVALTPAVAVV